MERLRERASRLLRLLRRSKMEREMEEEMRFHLDRQTEKNVRAGMSPREARRDAVLRFGGIEGWKADSREEARPRRLEELAQDLRYGLRSLAKSPGFTVIAVLTLALGIGANTALWSVFDRVLLRPLPLAHADRLMMLWETDRDTGTTREPSSVPDFLDFRAGAQRFEKLAAFAGAEVNLTPLRGEPTRLAALEVSHGYLELLGTQPLLGRAFREEDDRPGSPRVALLGESLWRRLFSRDPAVLGRTVRLDDQPTTVIGVVPDAAGFGSLQVLSAADYSRSFADRGRDTQVEIWLPLQPDPETSPRDTHPLFVLGRLAPGASRDAAQREMAAIAADLERQYPSNKARGAFVEPFSEVVFGPVRPALSVLLGAVGLVLLVACANLANLLFARGTVRLREVAVRTALGAGRARLARQFLVEGSLLSAAGVALGLLFARLGLRLLIALAPGGVPRLAEASLDGRVLVLTLGVSLLVALAVGWLPALQARGADLQSTLKGQEGPGATGDLGSGRWRAVLVVGELALAVTLLAGAGLLMRSFWLLRQTDPGFDPRGVVKAEFQLPATRYPADFAHWPNWPEQRRFFDQITARALALPGVESAAVAASHPLDRGFTNSFYVVGRKEEARDWPEISIRQVDPGYFETLRIPLLGGRRFLPSDGPNDPAVLLINEEAARRFFSGREPLGQKIAFWGTERTIVGIVRDERFHGLTEAAPPAAYAPLAQVPARGGSLLVRVQGDPETILPAVRAAIRKVDPELAVFGAERLTVTLGESVAKQRFTLQLVATFAALTLLLALLGVYGVLSYRVAQRTAEIGIRMALGAAPASVVRLVVRQGMRLALLGLALGLVGALAVTRFLASLLYGIGTNDPPTFAAVIALVFGTSLLASWLPARRATKGGPMAALRAR